MKEKKSKPCKNCIYRLPSYMSGNCNYYLVTGHRRPCPAEGCTVYEPGRRIKDADEDAIIILP